MRNFNFDSFILGAARAIDLGATITSPRMRRVAPSSEEAMRRDWEQVGEDLRFAIGEWKVRNAGEAPSAK